MTSRRGFTLVELLIAMVLLLIVTGATFQLLHNTQRVSRAQSERVDMQSNMRSGALFVPAELRMIGFDSVVAASTQNGTAYAAGAVVPDILGMAADSIAFRAIRAAGMICNYTAADAIVIDTTQYYSAYRTPQATRDSVLIYFDRVASASDDDSWFARPITGVASGTCDAALYGARNGLTISTLNVGAPGANPPDSIVIGSPFRTFEVMSYKLIQSGGKYWLGAKSLSANESGYQPVLGPLTANGFALKYYQADGVTETTVPRDVRTVQVTLISQSDQRVSASGAGSQAVVQDSVVTRVSLRNAMR
jgi:prepilin-type N-terminal cleavage/methylation domain-containing protein